MLYTTFQLAKRDLIRKKQRNKLRVPKKPKYTFTELVLYALFTRGRVLATNVSRNNSLISLLKARIKYAENQFNIPMPDYQFEDETKEEKETKGEHNEGLDKLIYDEYTQSYHNGYRWFKPRPSESRKQ